MFIIITAAKERANSFHIISSNANSPYRQSLHKPLQLVVLWPLHRTPHDAFHGEALIQREDGHNAGRVQGGEGLDGDGSHDANVVRGQVDQLEGNCYIRITQLWDFTQSRYILGTLLGET